MKKMWFLPILLIVVLSMMIAGCGGGGGGSTPDPTPTPTLSPAPTSSPTTEPITETEMNTLLDKTEQAMMRNADPTECFTEPDVDCGSVLGRLTPQAIIDHFGTEGAAFTSFEITGIITGSDTLELQLVYVWTGSTTSVPQGPCVIQVTKTSKGWRISSFGGVLQYFPSSLIQSRMLKR